MFRFLYFKFSLGYRHKILINVRYNKFHFNHSGLMIDLTRVILHTKRFPFAHSIHSYKTHGDYDRSYPHQQYIKGKVLSKFFLQE